MISSALIHLFDTAGMVDQLYLALRFYFVYKAVTFEILYQMSYVKVCPERTEYAIAFFFHLRVDFFKIEKGYKGAFLHLICLVSELSTVHAFNL